MPFKSKAQQRFMFAEHPKMAKEWADKTPDIKVLPEKVGSDHAYKHGSGGKCADCGKEYGAH